MQNYELIFCLPNGDIYKISGFSYRKNKRQHTIRHTRKPILWGGGFKYTEKGMCLEKTHPLS